MTSRNFNVSSEPRTQRSGVSEFNSTHSAALRARLGIFRSPRLLRPDRLVLQVHSITHRKTKGKHMETRRGFLKQTGAGVAGIGALTSASYAQVAGANER